MTTKIHFIGGDTLTVTEGPEAVLAVRRAAGGDAIRLTSGRGEVLVNGDAITYWHEDWKHGGGGLN